MEGRGKKKDKKIDLNIPHIIKALKKKKKQGHAFYVCSGHICSIGSTYCIII